MEMSEVKLINENLVCITGLKSVVSTMQDNCIFVTKRGLLNLIGYNLEILKLDLFGGSAVINGTIKDFYYK